VLQLLVSIQVVSLLVRDRALRALAASRHDDRGQSTAEYALVLLGAAAVAVLLVTWATKTDKVTKLMNSILDRVLDQVS
jgi:hypothetical protein